MKIKNPVIARRKRERATKQPDFKELIKPNLDCFALCARNDKTSKFSYSTKLHSLGKK
jgi:hypothetical protein